MDDGRDREEELVFAACAPGVEPLLAGELRALGLEARPVPGGAEAHGRDAVAWACLAARTADAVALRLYEGEARGLRAALAAARRAHGPAADLVTRREGARATLSLDAVGGPLFKRGWRSRVGAAPLRESLAAAMLLLGGYDGGVPLLDPMCGSGTLAIEAATMAARRAPGLGRRFAFESWPGRDPARVAAIRDALARRVRIPPAPILASDRNAGALRLARLNAAAAGVADAVRLERCDAAEVVPPRGPGLLVANPPFGVRLGEEVAASWRALGTLLDRLPGWTAVVLAPDRGLERLLLPRRPRDVLRVRAGGLACQLLVLAG